jgi:hypothetical protein
MLHNIKQEKLAREKSSSLLSLLVSYKENVVLRVWPQGCIHNILIYFYLMYGPNKLECYIALVRKGFPEANTLAYWALLLVTKKMECYQYEPRGRINQGLY